MRITILGVALAIAAAACGSDQSDVGPSATEASTTSPSSTTTASSTTSVASAAPEANVTVPDLTDGGVTLVNTTFPDGTPIVYAVVVPRDFDPGNEYPVFLAMPPGGQDAGSTFNVVEGWYRNEAVERGWVVVSPAAPNNVLWFQGSEQYIEEFLDSTLAWLRPEGGLFHIGGVSNGGRSTFRILGLLPDRFASVTVYPGFPDAADTAALASVGDIPFTLWVGGADQPWIGPTEQVRDELESLGRRVTYEVIPNAPHVIPELTDGERIFDVLDAARP